MCDRDLYKTYLRQLKKETDADTLSYEDITAMTLVAVNRTLIELNNMKNDIKSSDHSHIFSLLSVGAELDGISRRISEIRKFFLNDTVD